MRHLILILTPALPIQSGWGVVGAMDGAVVEGVNSAGAGLHLIGTGGGKTTN